MTWNVKEDPQGRVNYKVDGPTQEFAFYGHLISAAAPATAAAGVSAGTTPAAPTLTGNDGAGFIIFSTGTSPSTGPQVLVTFGRAFNTAPFVVHSEGTASLSALNAFVTASLNSFSIQTGLAPAASATYSVFYQVVGA